MSLEILNITCHEINKISRTVISLWNRERESIHRKNWKNTAEIELCDAVGILVASGKVNGVNRTCVCPGID